MTIFKRVPISGFVGLMLAATVSLAFSPTAVAQQTMSPMWGQQLPYGVTPYGSIPGVTGSYAGGYPATPYPTAPVRSQMPPAYQRPTMTPANVRNYAPITPQQTYAPRPYAPTASSPSAPKEYADYYTEANRLFQAGQLTEAIATYQKALPLAQGVSLPIAHNNLAAIFIKRGQYFLNQGQADDALNDFRHAVYYLEAGWPVGEAYSANQQRNRDIARQHLLVGYQKLGTPSPTSNQHRQWAITLRQQGKFEPALAEFFQVLEKDGTDLTALQATGDMFMVMNQPTLAVKALKQQLTVVEKTTAPSAEEHDKALVQVLSCLAHAENQMGDVDAAIAHLNKATDLDPKNALVLGQLEKIWRKELQFDAANPVVHANLGSVFQKQGQIEKAHKAYANAEKLLAQPIPGSGTVANASAVKEDIRLNEGTLFQDQKNYANAREAYESVLRANPNQPRALFLLAGLQEELKQPREAVAILDRLLTLKPQDDAVHQRYLGLLDTVYANDAMGKQQALMAYGNRYPQQGFVQQTVAERLHSAGKADLAVPYYRKAVALWPSNATLLANLGSALQASGQEAEAVAVLKKASTLDPKAGAIQDLLAKSQTNLWQQSYQQAVDAQQTGNHQQAIPLFEATVSKAQLAQAKLPVDFYVAYGASLQALNQLDKALSQYQQALVLEPNNANAYYYRATVYHQQQAVTKAEADYTKALTLPGLDSSYKTVIERDLAELKTGQADSLLDKAMSAYGSKQYTQALTLLSQAEAMDPSNGSVEYTRGLVLAEQKNYTAAIRAYQAALQKEPSLVDAYYGLGVAYELAKQPSQAKVAYQQYVDKAPASEDTKDLVAYAQSRVKELK
ncbi:MAG: tetratricopeptide repeat protein [Vampirovibrionales bacterium]|nr:tetratricopeptide repeat protein [Vampirovibrionales bacterium]